MTPLPIINMPIRYLRLRIQFKVEILHLIKNISVSINLSKIMLGSKNNLQIPSENESLLKTLFDCVNF